MKKTAFRYHIPVVRSLLLSALAFAADLYAIPAILRNKKAIAPEELQQVNAAVVPIYDRIALRQDAFRKDHYRKLSDNVLKGTIALAACLLLDKKIRAHAGNMLTLYVKTQAAAYTIYSYSPAGPAFRDRYRPVVYYSDVSTAERSRGNNRNAQYSGHTGNAAAASFFMAKIYGDYHRDRSGKTRALSWLLAIMPPALVGFLRIKALKHFPSDIAIAILIGGACGIIVPALHRVPEVMPFKD